MMKAQGALEYLIIIAAVLGISAVVVLFITGTFAGSSGGADISKCRLAAANCKKDTAMGLSSTCPTCDTACKDASGKDLLDGRTDCGLACQQCKQGSVVSGGGGSSINLAASWTLDEITGTSAPDSSGNGNSGTFYGETFADGTLSPGASWTTDRNGNAGKAVSFNGASSIVTTYSGPFLQDMTVSVWFSISDWQARAVLGRWHTVAGSGDQGWMLYRNAGDALNNIYWLFYYNDGSAGSLYIRPALSGLSLNTWYHTVAVIRADGTYSVYLNGNLITDLSYPGTKPVNFVSWGGSAPNSAIQMAIGRSSGSYGWWYSGSVDAVRIWNRALSASEATAEMNPPQPNTRAMYSWELDEGTGTIARDGHIWVAGKKGGALSFDGVDDYLTIPDSSSLYLTPAATLSVWIKTTMTFSLTSWNDIINSNGIPNCDNGEYCLRGCCGNIYTHYYNTTGNRGSITISQSLFNDGNWHQIVSTYDSSVVKIYLDGSEKSSTSLSGPLRSVNSPIQMGRLFNGAIDEVRLYNRTLSSDEIMAQYLSG